MKLFATAALFATALATASHAATIVAPVSVSVTRGGTSSAQFDAKYLINGAGLQTKYQSGVTNFEDFIALDQEHRADLNARWHSQGRTTTATLVFDFGQEVTLSKMAIWDDTSTTISSIGLSTDSGPFTTFAITDVVNAAASGAEVFNFQPIKTRYLTFQIAGCFDESKPMSWTGCGLNEVVFGDASSITAVPEPATWAMMIMGFGAAGAVLRRRRMALAIA